MCSTVFSLLGGYQQDNQVVKTIVTKLPLQEEKQKFLFSWVAVLCQFCNLIQTITCPELTMKSTVIARPSERMPYLDLKVAIAKN